MKHDSLIHLIYNQRPEPSAGFDRRIAQELEILAAPLQRKRPSVPRRTVVVAACLMLACTTALSAANPRAALEVLQRFFPEVIPQLQPVNMMCEHEGIRLEIISAAAQGSTAEVYFTLQDLTGSRLDATLDLTRSRLLHLSLEGQQEIRVLSFDSDTNTVHCLSLLKTTFGESIGGEKMLFSVRNIASRRQSASAVVLDSAAMAALPLDMKARPSVRYDIFQRTGNAIDRVPYNIIPTSGEKIPLLEGVHLVNAGYTDGELHVQLRLCGGWINGNKGYLTLTDGGKTMSSAASLSWRDGDDVLTEYIFDVTPAEAAGLCLEGEFTLADTVIPGEWMVCFSMETQP